MLFIENIVLGKNVAAFKTVGWVGVGVGVKVAVGVTVDVGVDVDVGVGDGVVVGVGAAHDVIIRVVNISIADNKIKDFFIYFSFLEYDSYTPLG